MWGVSAMTLASSCPQVQPSRYGKGDRWCLVEDGAASAPVEELAPQSSGFCVGPDRVFFSGTAYGQPTIP